MALDLSTVGNKIMQDNKTISGHKMCLVKARLRATARVRGH